MHGEIEMMTPTPAAVAGLELVQGDIVGRDGRAGVAELIAPDHRCAGRGAPEAEEEDVEEELEAVGVGEHAEVGVRACGEDVVG